MTDWLIDWWIENHLITQSKRQYINQMKKKSNFKIKYNFHILVIFPQAPN